MSKRKRVSFKSDVNRKKQKNDKQAIDWWDSLGTPKEERNHKRMLIESSKIRDAATTLSGLRDGNKKRRKTKRRKKRRKTKRRNKRRKTRKRTRKRV